MIRRILTALGTRFLTKEDALAIAKRTCLEEGWPWAEPVLVKTGVFTTTIWTNCDMKGGNVGIRLDSRDGRIVSAGFVNR